MSFARIYSAQVVFLKGKLVTVEIDISRGLNSFLIVGLPDKAVEEARDRISAAIKNSGFESPKSKNHKIIISLAPAELKKEGATFDVAMAISYLLASDEIKFDPEGKIFFGELALDGEVRDICGMLALAHEAKKLGMKEVYVPAGNAVEAALIEGIVVYPVHTLSELIEHLEANYKPEKQNGLKLVKPARLLSKPFGKPLCNSSNLKHDTPKK